MPNKGDKFSIETVLCNGNFSFPGTYACAPNLPLSPHMPHRRPGADDSAATWMSTSEGDRDYIRRVGHGDPRLVARIPPNYFMDWEAHSNGCDDIWDIAERIAECEKRKRCASS